MVRSIVLLLALLLVVLVGLVVLFKVSKHLWHQINPPANIAFDEFHWNGKKDDAVSGTLRSRFQLWQSRQEGPREDRAESVSFGRDSWERASTSMQALGINVGGVQLSGVLKALNDLTATPQYMLSGYGEFDGDRASLTVRLKLRGTHLREWSLTRSKVGLGEEKLKSLLLNDAVFRILYDLGTGAGPGRFKGRGESPMCEFPNDKAYSAYLAGTSHWATYLGTRSQAELDAAIAALRTLRWEMPVFTKGLDILALALTENRQEKQALEIFDYLLDSPKPLALNALDRSGEHRLEPDEKLRLLQLAYNRAVAHFKGFRKHAAYKAIRHMEALLDVLEKENESSIGDELKPYRLELESLRALSLAQLANIYGHLLTLLEPRELPEGEVRDGTKVAELRELKRVLDESDNNRPNMDESRSVIKAVEDVHEDLLRRAVRAREAAADYFGTKDERLSNKAKNEEAALDRLLKSAEGYTKYLALLWDDGMETDVFQQKCREAIGLLREAEAAQPHHYSVLENLGRIYLDREFDPDGDYLAAAGALYRRALELKKNDYWGYQQLAEAQGRALERRPYSAEAIRAAKAHVEAALKLREDDRRSKLFGARLDMWTWSHAPSVDLEKSITETLGPRRAVSVRSLEEAWAHAVWKVHRMRAVPPQMIDKVKDVGEATEAAAKRAYEKLRTELQLLVEATEKEHVIDWRRDRQHMIGMIRKMLDRVQKTPFEHRRQLRLRF